MYVMVGKTYGVDILKLEQPESVMVPLGNKLAFSSNLFR